MATMPNRVRGSCFGGAVQFVARLVPETPVSNRDSPTKIARAHPYPRWLLARAADSNRRQENIRVAEVAPFLY